jgi:hypothetical protein
MTIEPYSPDYHIVYGLHSGFPLCCVFNREETGKGGECPKCEEAGRDYEMHRCSDDIPACKDYIEIITRGVVGRIREKAEEGCEEISFANLRFASLIDGVINVLMDNGYVYDGDRSFGGTVVGVDSEGPPPKSYHVYKKTSSQ